MKPMETLLEILKRFTKANADSITESASLRRDLGLDSLQIAAIAGEIEDAFGVEVSDKDAAEATTVGDLLRLAVRDAN